MADTHLGCNWPVIPTKEGAQIPVYGRAFKYCIEKSIENNVDFILHAGDLVEHSRPNIPALRRSFSELRKLKGKDIPFVITRGTHDSTVKYFEKFGGDFLLVLEEEEKLHYVESSRKNRSFIDLKLEEGNVRIYGMADYGANQRTKLAEFSKFISREGSDFNILLMHTGLINRPYTIGAIMSTGDLRAIHSLVDYFALGHDHQRFEDKGNSIYNPGSIEFCSFKEASKISYFLDSNKLEENKRETKEKGFYIVDVENGSVDVDFIKLPTRNVLNIQVEFEDATPDEILDATSKALQLNTSEKAILRPIIAGTMARNYHVYDIKFREIQESVDALYVEWPTCLLEGTTTFVGQTSAKKDYRPLFQEYYQERGWTQSSAKSIAGLASDIVTSLNPTFRTIETREDSRNKTLKLIENFDLKKVKKKHD